jgi:hypothetical protein
MSFLKDDFYDSRSMSSCFSGSSRHKYLLIATEEKQKITTMNSCKEKSNACSGSVRIRAD